MTKVPIDLVLIVRPVSSYRFEDVVELLTKRSMPQFFDGRLPGGSLWQSELKLAVVCTPGVQKARSVRLSRASGPGGPPPELLEFTPEEVPIIGQIEVALDPTPQTRTPF